MGAVYKAVHEEIGRQAAIKVLLPEYVKNDEVARRFLNEARAVNLIRHPALVEIYDTERLPDGSACLIMEFLDGETLTRRIENARGRIPTRKILRIVWQLADVLHAVHERGIVHRDLKPSNAMLVKDSAMPDGERIKLLDFGIAKLAVDSARFNLKTGTGVTMGTVYYMSPEQCLGAKEVDGKADVYSLGVVLFEMLTGDVPFHADNPVAIIGMHMHKQPPHLPGLAPNVPMELVALVDSMLHKERDKRPSMGELAEAFLRLSRSPSLQDTDPDDQTVPLPPLDPKEVLAATQAASPPPAALSASRATTPASDSEAKPVRVAEASGVSGVETSRQPTGDTVAATAVRPEHPTQQILPRFPLLVGVLLGLGLLGGLGLLLPPLLRVRTKPQQAMVTQSVPIPAKQVPTKPLLVKWSIQSIPLGATVVRQADDAVLGVTPWTLERESGPGTVELLLRKDGYVPKSLSLPGNQAAERSERLDPLPPAATAALPANGPTEEESQRPNAAMKRKSGRLSGGTNKTRPTVSPTSGGPATPAEPGHTKATQVGQSVEAAPPATPAMPMVMPQMAVPRVTSPRLTAPAQKP